MGTVGNSPLHNLKIAGLCGDYPYDLNDNLNALHAEQSVFKEGFGLVVPSGGCLGRRGL